MSGHESGFIDRGNSEGYFALGWSPAAAAFLEKHKFSKLEFAGAWGDFGFIAKYANFIESLLLSNRDRGAEGVSALHNLRELCVLVKPKKPVNFTELKKLEKCQISWDKSYSSTLFALPKLKDVRIESFSEADFRGVAANASVENLDLVRPRLESLDGIDAFENLRVLALAYASRLSSFDGIEKLAKLKEVRVLNAQKLRRIPSLAGAEELETLVLGNACLSNLEFAYDMTRLSSLSVGGEPVDADWPRLLRLPSLLNLHIVVHKEGCPTEDQFKVLLAQAGRGCESLELYSTRKSNWVSVSIGMS